MKPTLALRELIGRLEEISKDAASRLGEQVSHAVRAAPALSSAALSSVLGTNDQPVSVDLVVAPNEISFAHGTGVLLTRMLENAPPFVTIRSFDHWGGKQEIQPLADHVLPAGQRNARVDVAAYTTSTLRHYKVRWILAVPYFREDVHVALAAKAATGAPMAVYVMDDNALHNDAVPLAELGELMEVADVRFAISPEMRTAYQNAFRKRIHVLPPLVADRFVRTSPSAPHVHSAGPIEAVLIGNIWHQSWLDRLWEAIKNTPVRLVWYASNETPHWLKLPEEAARSHQFVVRANTPTAELIRDVEKAPFVVVPTGTFDEVGHALGIAKLSLPSRMPFIVASSGTPIMVLGEGETAAAKFVKRFDLGEVAPYDPASITAAAQRLIAPERQRDIRTRACEMGRLFKVGDIYEFIRDAAVSGAPDAGRFERAFPIQAGEFGYHMPEAVPRGIIPDQVDMVRAFQRLSDAGFTPDTVVDVGASSGIWSYTLHSVFPKARYILIDPLFERYTGKCMKPGFEVIECAISDAAGTLEMQVSNDLYNSSLISVGRVARTTETLRVPVRTLDDVADEKRIRGRCVLKLDVQFAEHLALAGARRMLRDHVDIVMLELTLQRLAPQAKIFSEMIDMMRDFGFEYYDEVGEWRNPADGRLEQKDVLFARADMFS